MKLLLALLCLLVPALAGFYEKSDTIVQLTASNFDAEVYGSEHAWMIEFYAPWCGHCQRLVPEYEKAAENLKGLVKVGSVNCDDQSNQPICARFQIQGFPTLKLFPGATKAKANKRYVKEPKDYQGARTARAMVDASLAEMPNFSIKLGKQRPLEEFLEGSKEIPKAILFTTKATTAPLFKALSVDFNQRLLLAEVRDLQKEIVARFGVEKFPTLLVIPDSSAPDTFVTYDGPLQHTKLTEFLENYALPAQKKPTKGADKEDTKKEPPVEAVFNPEIVQLRSQKDLAAECLDRATGMCLISFMALEEEFEESVQAHAEQLKVLKAVKKAAHDKKMPFNILWLNALTESKLLNTFNLSDQFPSLLVISPTKKVFRPFTGGFDEQSIIDFLEETSKARGRFFKFDFVPTMSVAE